MSQWTGKDNQQGENGYGRGTAPTLSGDSVSPAVKQHSLLACGITRLKYASAHILYVLSEA